MKSPSDWDTPQIQAMSAGIGFEVSCAESLCRLPLNQPDQLLKAGRLGPPVRQLRFCSRLWAERQRNRNKQRTTRPPTLGFGSHNDSKAVGSQRWPSGVPGACIFFTGIHSRPDFVERQWRIQTRSLATLHHVTGPCASRRTPAQPHLEGSNLLNSLGLVAEMRPRCHR